MANKPIDIKTDILLQEILKSIRSEPRRKYRTTDFINLLFGTHSADSNDRNYRKVLKRLNWLYENGYIHAEKANGYTPTKWHMIKDRL